MKVLSRAFIALFFCLTYLNVGRSNASDLGTAGGGAACGALFNWLLPFQYSEDRSDQPRRDKSETPSHFDLGISGGLPGLLNLVVQKRMANGYGLRLSGMFFGPDNWGGQVDLLKSFYYDNEGSETSFGLALSAGMNGTRLSIWGPASTSRSDYYGLGLDAHLAGFYLLLGAGYYQSLYELRISKKWEHEYIWLPTLQLGYLWSFD